ncbi:fibronectin type III domain-containing protein [Marispirochaeta sp.]|uniref:fibronectin type III domain-containing protein n=1 Tax=Marispirochaeta sp. TaxID=2038653 RepID=UPI0029C64762|nr:fibronectin type III domain-containing protein [Marispirochaeta sp.]
MKLKNLNFLFVLVLMQLISCKDPSDSFHVVIIPKAPSGLSGTAESGTGVNLSWTDNADNEESFTVERSEDGGAFSSIVTGLAANTESYSDAGFGLDSDHSLVYRVYATNSVGDSGYSNTASVSYTAPLTVPDAPSGLSGTAEFGTGVNLSWTDNADNEESFTVERSEDGGAFSSIVTGLAANTESYSDTGFDTDENHSLEYRVYATNVIGDSGYSNEIEVSYTAPLTAPDAPSGLSGTAISGSGVTLGWTDNADNEESFTVERNLDGAGYVSIAAGLAADTESFTDSGFDLDSDHSLVYRVYATNSVGDSGYSNTASVSYTAPLTVPDAPSDLSGTAESGTGVTLSWTDNADNEESFTVERTLDGAGYVSIAAGLAADTESYSDTGFDLDSDHSLVYRVYATNSVGNSGYSNTASVSYTAPLTVPDAPSGLSGTVISGSGVNLSWTDNADNETSYTVERSEDGGTYSLIAALAADAVAYQDVDFVLTTDHNFSYRVYASNSAGDSDFSNENIVNYTAPGTPYLIINHNSIAEFDGLTSDQIEAAKKVLLIISGESHGRGYGYGLESLAGIDSTYSASTNWSGEAESYRSDALRWNRAFLDNSTWNTSMGEEDFWTNSAAVNDVKAGLEYIESNYTGKVIFGLGWCWDMTWHNSPTTTKDPVYSCGWAGSTVDGPDGDLPWGLDAGDSSITGNSLSLVGYLEAVEEYNTDAPGVITIFTTGPVDGNYNNELGYQRWLKHERIREYVQTNGGVLFDYADILSYDYTNNQRFTESWDGHNWHGINPSYDDSSYDGGDGGCHITEAACIQLAKGLWVMAAKIADWDS